MKQEIKERVERIRKGEVPEGYKETKVGIIPVDWKITTFQDIADKKVKWSITGGPFGSNLKASEYTSDGVRIIQLQNIGDGVFNDDYKIYTSEEKANELLSCNIYPSEIILSKMGDPVARACFIPNKGMRFLMSSDGIRLVIDESRFSKKFIHDYINSMNFRKRAFNASIGSTRLRIGLQDLKKLLLIAPPLSEQQKIAEIFSTWDKAIELKEKLIKEKKEFKRGLMQNLFAEKIRFSEFNTEWKTVIIKDVFEEVKRINGNNSKDIDILTISAKHGFLSQKDKFSKVIAGNSLKKYTHLFQNEFAYNKGNSKTAPFGCIFKLDTKEGLVPFVYICFRPTQMIDVDFFDFYFKHGLLDRQLKRIITSGARSDGLLNVSKNNFFKMKILLPSIEEQKKIGLTLKLIQNKIDYLSDELNQLKEQKRGLMQLLLTGIVRVEVD